MTKPRSSGEGPLYLVIDQGSHASRALVYDRSGKLVSQAYRDIPLSRPGSCHLEHDPQTLLDSVTSTIEEAVQALGDARGALVCAGLATQRSTIACWDRLTGAALAPIISWQDRRAHGQIEMLRAHAAEVRAITGLTLSAHYGASKLGWCLEHIPAVRAACEEHRLAWGPVASFLLYHLLRERPLYTDPVNAARTLLWDLAHRDWSTRMLELFRLPRDPLPQVVSSRHQYGTLGCAGVDTPVTVVTGDQNAALYADGPPRSDTLYITIGTGAFVLRVTGASPIASTRLLSGLVFDDGDMPSYALEGTVNGAGSALAWLAAKNDARDLVDELHDWLDACEEPPLFLNGVSGLGTPFMLPEFESRFIGAGALPAQAVAILESIVFLLQVNIEEISRETGHLLPPAVRVHVGGGLSRYDGLCRRLADLSGLPVQRTPLAVKKIDKASNKDDEMKATGIEATGDGLARLLRSGDTVARAESWRSASEDNMQTFMPAADRTLQTRYRRWHAALMAAVG